MVITNFTIHKPWSGRQSTRKLLFLVLLLYHQTNILVVDAYNRPGCEGWPTPEQWDQELRQKLTDPDLLHGPFTRFPNAAYAERCLLGPQDLNTVLNGGDGLCQANHGCINQRCQWRDRSNLPAYTLEAQNVLDIQTALQFANTYDIAISIKGTGHNWQGQNSHPHSLLIWVRNFPQSSQINHQFTDSCGTNHGTTITVNAGEMFGDIMDRIGDDYLIVKGFCSTVGASGGWVNGGGLSELSREFGYGVDNVRSFQVVLASGELVTADACSHTDLFWALRGGGGGNWGVIISVEHQLYEQQPMAALDFGSLYVLPIAWNPGSERALVQEWVRFFVTHTPDADWAGGFINPTGGSLRYLGTVEEARNSTLIKLMDSWYESLRNKGIQPAYGKPSTLISEFHLTQARSNFASSDVLAYSVPPSLGRGMSRFLPLSVVRNEPEAVIELIVDLIMSNELMNIYYLGGQAAQVPTNSTSTHPGLRQVVFGLEPTNHRGDRKILDFANGRENEWGVSYNHHDALEADWQTVLYGDQYLRLHSIKQKYDPQHRFNVYHGVDYQEYDKAFQCGRRDFFVNAGFVPYGLASFLGLILQGKFNLQMGVFNGVDEAP